MENSELTEMISNLIDKYFTNPTNSVLRDSDSIWIRQVLQERIGEYFKKSQLNEILINKGFKFLRVSDSEFSFNISKKDIQMLYESKSVLEELKRKTNFSFQAYTMLPGYKKADNYKYTFKYWIKIKLRTNHSEYQVYCILAKETGLDPITIRENIEIFNLKDALEMPSDLHKRLLDIFNINYDESITNNNYCR